MRGPVNQTSAQRKKDRESCKYGYGVCRIRRRSEGQSLDETVGSGFLVRDLITPNFISKLCLVTSDKVIVGHDLKNYHVEFKESESTKLVRIELDEIASSDIHRTSGLIFIGISIGPTGKKKKKKLYKNISCRSYNVVRERLRSYEDLFCFFVDDSQEEFLLKGVRIEQNGRDEFYARDGGDTFSTYSRFTQGKPYGGVILKNIGNELLVVGVLEFTNEETMCPVFFPISARKEQSETAKYFIDQGAAAGVQDSADSTSGSEGIYWWPYLKSWLPFGIKSGSCSDDGNSSLNPSGSHSFDISIGPSNTPLKGGGPFYVSFIPDLPSDISSGTAMFRGLFCVELYGLKDEADCLIGRSIPPAEAEGWVTVTVLGKSDKTGESYELGQTEIYYFDIRAKVLKLLVQEEEQRRHFFEVWKTALEGPSTASRVTETKSPSSGSMNSGNPLHSLQGSLPLPENVARAFGHEDTVQFVECISKRFSEDLSVDEEDAQASRVLELAEADKNQSDRPERSEGSLTFGGKRNPAFEQDPTQETAMGGLGMRPVHTYEEISEPGIYENGSVGRQMNNLS